METLPTLKRRARRQLRDYTKAEAEARTPITRGLAATLVDAREHFLDSEGHQDWNGKTYPYRRWVRDVFDESDVDREESKRIQAAIRYHVGSVLRERLSPEQLEDAGLIPQTPRERSTERRQTRTAVLNALNARDVAGGSLMALTALNAIVQRIDAEEVSNLDESTRAVAVATLADLDRRIKVLRRRLR
jgi:hypothetical protein